MNNIANPLQRLLAYFIDFVVWLVLPVFLIYSFSMSSDLTSVLNKASFYLIFLALVYPLIYAFATPFLISNFGGTIGKLLTGTKIVSSAGKNLGFWKAFFRNHIGYMVSGLFVWLGFIWILIDKEKRAWHDQIADSYVIVTNKLVALLGILFLIVVIFIEFWLGSTAWSNFRINSFIYEDIYKTVRDYFQTTNAKIYTTKGDAIKLGFPKVIFNYPAGWTVNEDTNSSDSNKPVLDNVAIVKNNYAIYLSQELVTGAGACYFKDSPTIAELNSPGVDLRTVDYVEIDSNFGHLRYFKWPIQSTATVNSYGFCEKDIKRSVTMGKNVYVVPVVGYLSLNTPTKQDDATFQEALNIVKSMKPLQ